MARHHQLPSLRNIPDLLLWPPSSQRPPTKPPSPSFPRHQARREGIIVGQHQAAEKKIGFPPSNLPSVCAGKSKHIVPSEPHRTLSGREP
ncbi:hypothetical protein CSOJ01_11748 [Colletotrichum sojae]|uniref:Uncharacterized protein n=1 Tax=Colletotrichum sojae TaxID=2175907 RepID=A0A8H6IWV4_9PEZI|nr:hypothetical protein CSOJ01_11748 [Colletotrichum sojae]